jgi:hypothetical protein
VDASAIAANGEIYVAGSTSLADRWGGAAIPLSTTVADAGAFVARLNTDLSAAHRISLLEQFTIKGMTIAANGDVYLAGNSFLGKSVLFGETLEGDIDAVVVKLNPALTSILAAKVVGGADRDEVISIALLPTGEVVLSGETESSDFPATSGAFDASCGEDGQCDGGRSDGFIAILSSDLSSIQVATFVGGDRNDSLGPLAITDSGEIYVAGEVQSGSFSVSNQAYLSTLTRFGLASFVGKFNSDLSLMTASTFWHNGSDGAYPIHDMALSGEQLLITGAARSAGFPVSATAFQKTYFADGCSGCTRPADAYIAKLDAKLTQVLGGTLFGKEQSQVSRRIVTDSSGNIFIAGTTSTDSKIPLIGAFDSELSGMQDLFVAGFDSSLSTLLGSSFLGGDNISSEADSEGVAGLLLGLNDKIIVTGSTTSPSFPTTANAFDKICGEGQCDFGIFGNFTALPEGFVTILDFNQGNSGSVSTGECVPASISDSLIMSFPALQAGQSISAVQFSFQQQIGDEYQFTLLNVEATTANTCAAILDGANLVVPQITISGTSYSISFGVKAYSETVVGFTINSIL